MAQSSKKSGPVNIQKSVNKAADKLTESLDENATEEKIAADYESLAKELQTQKEYAKAEDYLKKAKQIYVRKNNKNKWYTINRELAKTQEDQGKYADAITNYEEAATITNDASQKELNLNDAGRVKNHWKPEAQSKFIEQKIVILEERGSSKEKATAFKQMAENQIQLNQNTVAIENYEKALKVLPEEEGEANSIQKEMADVYVAEKEYDKAIDINENLLRKNIKSQNVDAQIEQLKSLSELYLFNNKREDAITSLKQAYQLAIQEGRTIEAKNCAELLSNQYLKEKDYQKSIDLYEDFLRQLEALIQTDSTLIDAKIFQLTEGKIAQLEKEKLLKDKLIDEKNTFNAILIISLVLLVVLLFVIAKAFFAIKNKNKKIALQSLRREMNPHFIFNSLNSVNQFIAQNKEIEANKYLTSYSRLMRNMMENSNKDFIKLSKELEQLREYLTLEQLRFSDKFDYIITLDESIDPESTSVPNMLIQPQLENAIWHGLRYKEEKGYLKLDISQINKEIIISIEDNGIGLTRSQEIKTENQKIHESRGLMNVQERINLLNELYKTTITLEIKEKPLPDTGVIVVLQVGYIASSIYGKD